jgi:GrpB-like predicted nucleotidyltransferase (UPF0157 family)
MMANETTPIVVVDYDPSWTLRFQAEKASIECVLGPALVAIEHIGSTAVAGLAAKPIVDMLAGVSRLSDARSIIGNLESLGYEYVPEYEKEMPERKFFRKSPGGLRTFNLHMVQIGGPFWGRHLLFRDWLREHPEDCDRYAALKRSLARQFKNDVDQYTDAKTEFISEIESIARAALVERTRGHQD